MQVQRNHPFHGGQPQNSLTDNESAAVLGKDASPEDMESNIVLQEGMNHDEAYHGEYSSLTPTMTVDKPRSNGSSATSSGRDLQHAATKEDVDVPLISTGSAPGPVNGHPRDGIALTRLAIHMAVLYTFGVAVALMHHFIYDHFSGRPSTKFFQQRLIRVGNTCAWLFQTGLAAAVGLAYTQRIWWNVRRTAFRISALDSLFSLSHSPLGAINLELLRHAYIAVGIAAIAMCLPIAGIITPGTLTVAVATFDRSAVKRFSTWPSGRAINRQDPYCIYNQYGDLTQPAHGLVRVASQSLVSGSPVILQDSPCGQNCTFGLDFYAPGLQCSTLLENITLLYPPSDKNYSNIWPNPNATNSAYIYYAQPLFDKSTNITSLNVWWTPPNPADGGAGIIPGNSLKCDISNTSYHVDFTYHSTEAPSVNISVKDRSPIRFDFTMGTVYGALGSFSPNLPSPLLAQFSGNTASFTASFCSIKVFLNFLQGSITDRSLDRLDVSSTQIQETTYVDRRGWLSLNTSAQGIQAFERMMQYHSLSSMLILSPDSTSATTTSLETSNIFRYDPVALWLAYGIALLCVGVCLFVGFWTARINGGVAMDTFSEIIIATRNPTLDEALCDLGSTKQDRKNFENLRLQYGELKASNPPRLSFGTPDDVGQVLE